MRPHCLLTLALLISGCTSPDELEPEVRPPEGARAMTQMSRMHVEIGLFDGDSLLARDTLICGEELRETEVVGSDGHTWTFTSRFEEPSSPVGLECLRDGKRVYHGALQVGVHDSDDWESIDLAGVHTMAFRCRVERSGSGR